MYMENTIIIHNNEKKEEEISQNKNNIDFFLQEYEYLNDEDEEDKDNIIDISTYLKEFEALAMHNNNQFLQSDDEIFVQMKNYDINYNIKQLNLICEYYGLSKNIRLNKMKKQEIIEQILLFENNTENIESVIKRKECWFYLNELKNDKMMKKYIIW